jgi:hypothetical protein
VSLSAQVVNSTLIGNLHIELTFSHMVPAAVVGLEPDNEAPLTDSF